MTRYLSFLTTLVTTAYHSEKGRVQLVHFVLFYLFSKKITLTLGINPVSLTLKTYIQTVFILMVVTAQYFVYKQLFISQKDKVTISTIILCFDLIAYSLQNICEFREFLSLQCTFVIRRWGPQTHPIEEPFCFLNRLFPPKATLDSDK